MALVQSTILGRILHVHLNSPHNLNALSGAMMSAIKDALSPEQVRGVSVVLLTSAGRHFGAGHDLSELTSSACEAGIFRKCSDLMQHIAACEVPVVAAVQGCAFAAGCQLAATCDIVLSTEDAKFATPGVKIGFFCSTPSVPLVRSVPAKVASDMLFSARQLSATEALQAGLISRIVPGGKSLVNEAIQLCHTVAEAPREVLVGGKALLRRQAQGLKRDYEDASKAMEDGIRKDAATEGIAAFLQRRPPLWPSQAAEVAQAVALLHQGVACVSASPNQSQPSQTVFTDVQRRVPAYLVNPSMKEVAGIPVFKDLSSVSAPFAVVCVSGQGSSVAEAIDATIALANGGSGVQAVWLQAGTRAPEAEARARAAGLVCVVDRCLKGELEHAGMHQGISKL